MFGLIRLVFVFFFAALLGVFFERNAHSDRCREAGGKMVGALCRDIAP